MAGSDLRIREAVARDALPLAALRRAVVEEGIHFIGTSDEEGLNADVWEVRVRSAAAQRNRALFVGRTGGTVVGYLAVGPLPYRACQHVVKLELAIAAAHRGKGLGRALVEHAQQWAVDVGVEKIGLNVFADNLAAIALYEALGFETEGRRRFEYKTERGYVDDVLMAWYPPSN